jgi:exopolysaccharide production protein ExoZ
MFAGATRAVSSGATRAASSIEGVQYLRALAALMVVFHHARWFLPVGSLLREASWAGGGSRGVDIFFVISGFVMAHSTRTYDAEGSRPHQALVFLVKRLIRVVPFYWLAVLWDAKKMILQRKEDLDLAKDFLFVPHFNDHGHGMIWPHLFQGWTINYEMFFYVLFGLTMLVGRRRYLFLCVGLLGLTVVGAVASSFDLLPGLAAFKFYTSSLLLEFVMGICLCEWMTRHPPKIGRMASLCVALASLAALVTIPVDDLTRGVVDGLLASAIVWSTVAWAAGTNLSWLRRLGDASYSIYLFHMAFIGPAARLFARWHLAQPEAFVTAELAVVAVLGLVLHYAVEKQLLNRLRGLAAWIDRSGRQARYSFAAPP